MRSSYENWEMMELRKLYMRTFKYVLFLAITSSIILPIGLFMIYWKQKPINLPIEVATNVDLFFLKSTLLVSIGLWIPVLSLIIFTFISFKILIWYESVKDKILNKIAPLKGYKKKLDELNKIHHKKFPKFGNNCLILLILFALIILFLLAFGNIGFKLIYSLVVSFGLLLVFIMTMYMELSWMRIMHEHRISTELRGSFQLRFTVDTFLIILLLIFLIHLISLPTLAIYTTTHNLLEPFFQNLVVKTAKNLNEIGFGTLAERVNDLFWPKYSFSETLSDFSEFVLPMTFSAIIILLLLVAVVPLLYEKKYINLFSNIIIFNTYMISSYIIQKYVLNIFYLPAGIISSIGMIIVLYLSNLYLKPLLAKHKLCDKCGRYNANEAIYCDKCRAKLNTK